MQITTVSVGWKETCSLPDYANVSPSLQLTATFEAGEDAADAESRLLNYCKTFCRNEIDAALEANGQPPKFDTGTPRYVIYAFYPDWIQQAQVAVIVPAKLGGTAPRAVVRPGVGQGIRRTVSSVDRWS